MTDRLPYATVRKSNHWLWFLLLPLFLLLAACPQHFRWNQKLTITVNTPHGPVVASAVQRVSITYIPKWMSIDGTSRLAELNGESPVVNLGRGRIVLTILDQDFRMESLFNDLGRRPERFRRIQNQVGEPPRLIRTTTYLRPSFVSFTDTSDPSTAFEFYGEDFPKVFGPGYTLHDMTLEITDEPVSIGTVERILGPDFFPTLERLVNQRIADRNAGTAGPGYFQTIGRWAFIRDFK